MSIHLFKQNIQENTSSWNVYAFDIFPSSRYIRSPANVATARKEVYHISAINKNAFNLQSAHRLMASNPIPPFQRLWNACNLLKLEWNWFHSRVPLLISHFMMPSSPISVIAFKASKMCLCELPCCGVCTEKVSAQHKKMETKHIWVEMCCFLQHMSINLFIKNLTHVVKLSPPFVGAIKTTKYALCCYQPIFLYRVAHGMKLTSKTGKLSR